MRRPDFVFYPFPARCRLAYYRTQRAQLGERLSLVQVYHEINDWLAAKEWTSVEVFVGSKNLPRNLDPPLLKLHFESPKGKGCIDFRCYAEALRLCAPIARKFFKLKKGCRSFTLYVR